MAFFRTVFQILSVNLQKKPVRYVGLLNEGPKYASEVFTEFTKPLRSFWKNADSTVEYSSCKKPADNPLVTRGDPSKCLQGLDNVKENLEPCEKESFWTYLFGKEAKSSSEPMPDPCTCRLAYKFKERCREQDPRLCDPRYSATPGDVLLYTEFAKPSLSKEPQPQPPPAFKIPTSVTCKRIADAVAEHNCVHLCPPYKSDDCTAADKCLKPTSFRIPYAEFRAAERVRAPFTCEDGKLAEDVMRPIRKEMYRCGFPLFASANVDPHAKLPKKFPTYSSSEDESDSSTCKYRKKVSRIERLKKLTARRQGMYRSFL